MRGSLAELAPPSSDKRWRIVDTRMRRLGRRPDALIEVLHSVQEAFGYLDDDALAYVAASHARLIEVLHAVERLDAALRDPIALAPRVRAEAGVNRDEGVGVAEAPRGTLIHHYRVDEHGLVHWANLIIATGHNSLAMNRSVLEAARRCVHGDRFTEPMLNRVEAVIRCYDPCLSCSTHAVGQMPLHLRLLGPGGEVLDELAR